MAALRTSKSYAADKDSLIGRLNKMEGQVRGIRRMVEEDRHRVDILQQIASLPALPGIAGPAVGQSTTAFCGTAR